MTTYETEIETARDENAAQEFERKKMAEVVKRFGDGRGIDVSAREELVSIPGFLAWSEGALTSSIIGIVERSLGI